MTGIFDDAAKDAFVIWLDSVGGGLPVVNQSNECQGIVQYTEASSYDSNAVAATDTGTAHCLTDEIGELSYAKAVKVNGKRVFVTAVRHDAAKIITTFDFQETNPVTDATMEAFA